MDYGGEKKGKTTLKGMTRSWLRHFRVLGKRKKNKVCYAGADIADCSPMTDISRGLPIRHDLYDVN